MRLTGNVHTHTTFCDGKNTAREMAEAALAKGFDTLGYSGHMDPSIHMDLPAYQREIARLREEYAGRLDILCGVELDQYWETAEIPGAEYVIGSTHFLRLPDGHLGCVDWKAEILEDLCREHFGGDWYRLTAAYYAAEAEVWERTHCDIIGHFDLVARFNHEVPAFDEEDPRYWKPALEAMERLTGTGALFELNCGAYNRGRRRDFYPAERLLRQLRLWGGELVITSDAHQAELLDGGFADAVEKARACGFQSVWMPGHRADGTVDMRLRRIAL